VKGFPIVSGDGSLTLVGYIERSELRYVIGEWCIYKDGFFSAESNGGCPSIHQREQGKHEAESTIYLVYSQLMGTKTLICRVILR